MNVITVEVIDVKYRLPMTGSLKSLGVASAMLEAFLQIRAVH